MSVPKRKSPSVPKEPSAVAAKGWRAPVWIFVLGAAAFIAALVFFSLWDGKPSAGPTAARAEQSDLIGRWLRPDGGYILDIRGAGADGKLEVGYFNPSPIKVARAEVSREGDLLTVFVELRDVNYPGSTYTLQYDPANRLLVGEYIQPLNGQRFTVVFVRESQ